MRKHFYLLITLLITGGILRADETFIQKLQQIAEISDIKEIRSPYFGEAYEFFFEQPINHDDPSKGTFKQLVMIGHKSYDSPVVAVLEGYALNWLYPYELTQIFNTNQINIEHRFFNRSIPPTGIPWDDLKIKQAATDQHKIIQALRKHLYPESKWISTGISKGGQTVTYHRYFYPEDVDISVPYVAPINLDYIDPRLEKQLNKLGETPEFKQAFGFGGKEYRMKIFDFQKKCFENLNSLLPLMKDMIKEKRYTFEMVGGDERALKMVILEFPFAFWQWGGKITDIPELELEDWEEIFNYLTKISTPDFFDDSEIKKIHAFYYAALTETGMYAYNIRPFKKFFKGERSSIIDFRFTLPKGYEEVPFDKEQLRKLNHWLQTDADQMLFIYGILDPWSGSAVELKNNSKCKVYKANTHHGCRIKDFDGITQSDIKRTLKKWLTGEESDEEEFLIE